MRSKWVERTEQTKSFPWWQWPRSEVRHYYAPWYAIIARIPGWLLLQAGRVIYTLGAFLAFGVSRAIAAWKDTR